MAVTLVPLTYCSVVARDSVKLIFLLAALMTRKVNHVMRKHGLKLDRIAGSTMVM